MLFEELILNCKKSKSIEVYITEKESFNLWVQGTTSNRFPSLNKEYYTSEKMDLLKRAFSFRSNPILKARYAEIIFEVNKREREFGKLAAQNLLKASYNLIEQNFELKYSDSLDRALALSIFLKDQLVVLELVKIHEQGIEKATTNNLPYALSNLINSLTSKTNQLKQVDLKYDFYDSCIRKYISSNEIASQTTYSNQRMLLEEILHFPTTKINLEYKKKIGLEIGKSYEKEGDFVGSTRSKQVAAHYYEQALSQYLNSGQRKELTNRIKVKIREAYNYAVQNEFDRVPIKMSVPIAAIEKALSKYKNKNKSEMIQILINDPNGMISYSSTEKVTKENIHPINPFTITPLRKGIKVANVDSVDDRIKNEVIQIMTPAIEFNIRVFLDPIFNLLLSNNRGFTKELSNTIKNSECVDATRIKTIEHAIELYQSKDYISSMHIIVFQIEAILRIILQSIEGGTFNYRSKSMTELTLGTIISKLLEKKTISVDLLRYLEVNLTDQRGKNLRNDIAHGNRNFKEFNKYDNQLLIYLLMKVSSIKKHDL